MTEPVRLVNVYATPLEAIRRAEFRLAVPMAERLDFVSTVSPQRAWMSRVVLTRDCRGGRR